MIYTLDTNVFVDALRQPPELDRLKAFLSWALPSTVLSSIVASELAAGARSEKARRLLDDALLVVIPPSLARSIPIRSTTGKPCRRIAAGQTTETRMRTTPLLTAA